MRHAVVFVLNATLIGCSSVSGPSAPFVSGSRADVEAQVRHQVERFADAYRDADVATIDRLLARTYIHSNSGHPPSDRAGYMRWNRTRADRIHSGQWTVEQYALTELSVTVFDASVVATGRVTARGQRETQPWSSDIRFTNVWIKEDGQWRRAAFHDAAVP